MGSERPKGYNNPLEWDKIESSNKQIKIIEDDPHTDIEFTDAFTDDNTEQVFNNDDNFNDVLSLTEYSANSSDKITNYVVADYTDINTEEINKKHTLEAKNFVNKITKFILDFNDIELTEDHKKYIKQVGALQFQHLTDLLYLTDVNKQMMNNIISRVNATQAEDYAIINSYTNLVNQHLKLIKELQNSYKSIPSVMKKMRSEVLCDQQLGSSDDLNIEDYNLSQTNNGKHLAKIISERRKEKEREKDKEIDKEI